MNEKTCLSMCRLPSGQTEKMDLARLDAGGSDLSRIMI